jgi:hypothetical protein
MWWSRTQGWLIAAMSVTTLLACLAVRALVPSGEDEDVVQPPTPTSGATDPTSETGPDVLEV